MKAALTERVMVVSNLVNRATVLLNYRLGDAARMLTAGGEIRPVISLVGSGA